MIKPEISKNRLKSEQNIEKETYKYIFINWKIPFLTWLFFM